MSKLDYKTHNIKLNLPDGIRLKLLLHSHTEHAWFFEYRFIQRENDKPTGKVIRENEIKLYINYLNGKVSKIEATMHLINYEKLGKKYLFGLDVSPGSKMYLQYKYKKSKKDFHLKEIEVTPPHTIIKIEKGIIPDVENYFILPDKLLVDDWGDYNFPFKTSEGKDTHFTFPRETIYKTGMGNKIDK